MMSWPWLLQHLVSVSVLVALVWLICLGLKNRPAWRHALWLVVLIKLVTPAFVTWPWTVDEIAAFVRPENNVVSQDEQQYESSVPVSAPEPMEVEPAPALVVPEIELTTTDGLTTEEIVPVFAEDVAVEPLIVSVPEREEPVVDRSEIPVPRPAVIPVERHSISTADEPAVSAPLISAETVVELGLNGLLGLWIIGSAVFLLVQPRRLLVRRAVIRRGEPPARELVAEIERVSRELNMKPVRATVVREIASPFLWCLGRPTLAWPSDMSDAEILQQSRGIIAHELAHIRRRDHWVTWLELAAGVIWWWNPLFWLVRRRLREASEMACDAVALSLYDERKTYAELFLKLSTNLPTGAAAPVLGVSTGHSASIERRIRMIMSDRVSGKMSGWGILAVICFAVVVLPSLSVGQDVPAAEPEAPSLSDDVSSEDEPDAGESTVAKSLHGTWVLTDRRVTTNPQPNNDFDFFMINIDTRRQRIVTCWKRGEETGFSECRLIIDTTHAPHRLIYDFVHDMKLLKIFTINNEQLKIAGFQDYRIASTKTPTIFDDPQSNAEPIVIETFERPTEHWDHVAVGTEEPDKARSSNQNRPRNPDAAGSFELSPHSTRLSDLLKSSQPAADPRRKTGTGPLAAQVAASQPAKAARPQRPNQTDGSEIAELLRSQALPEIKVSPDEELQKLQRRWLEINVESAQAASESAKTTYEFRKRLNEKGVISSTELEQSQAELRQTELQLERAKLLLQMFELQAKRQENQWRLNKKQIDSLPTY